MQVINARNGPIVITDYHVTFLKAGFRRRATGSVEITSTPVSIGEVVVTHEPAVKRHDLSIQTDVAAAHAAIFDQLPGDEFSGVDGDGETDSLRGEDDSGVDADHLTARVDQGPPELPGFKAASV